MAEEHEKFEHLVRQIDPRARFLRARELRGGVSARVTALDIERTGGLSETVIVRQHGHAELERNPQIAGDEFKLLQTLRSAGLPVPIPYYVDESGRILSSPYIVVEYIDGEPEFAPDDLSGVLTDLVTNLSRIHSVRPPDADLSFLPDLEEAYTRKLKTRPDQLDESLDEGRIRDTLEANWPPPRRNEPVLLHGDFWPGNVLWKEGRLAGIIDWEDAAIGDPVADLANSRLEMLWAFGIEAMYDFTQRYQSLTGIDTTGLPHWDLCATLRPAGKIALWAGDPAREQLMRERHRWFTALALEKFAVC